MTALTERQLQVLRLVHEGLSLREIASSLGLKASSTVMRHIDNLVELRLLWAAKGISRSNRYVLTAAGLAAIGLRECGACCGRGTVSADFGGRRTGAQGEPATARDVGAHETPAAPGNPPAGEEAA